MTLNEINKIISLLVKNIEFKNMLEPDEKKKKELEEINDIANLYYLDDDGLNYLSDFYNETGKYKNNFRELNINCNNLDDIINIVNEFYRYIGIPQDVFDKVKIKKEEGLDRASSTCGEIKVGEYDNVPFTFDYLRTVVHEYAHCIRYFSKQKETEDLIAEIESIETEEIFYKWLINENKKIIKDGNELRCLKTLDVDNYRTYNERNEKLFIIRAKKELNLVNLLRYNFKLDESNVDERYLFIKEKLENIKKNGENIDIDDLKEIAYLKDYYLPHENEKVYDKNGEEIVYDGKSIFDLKNGKHITNEFRFVIARLITEYINKKGYLDELNNQKIFAKYLLDEEPYNMLTFNDLLNFLHVKCDALVANQIENYEELKNKLVNDLPVESSRKH